jgi:hypothetical protein
MSGQDEIQFWRSGDWTMVYLNGKLVKSGDHYHADEWLQERCGVVMVDDDAGFSIPDGFHPIETLSEVQANADAATERAARAEKLRQQAAELTAEAQKIEAGDA